MKLSKEEYKVAKKVWLTEINIFLKLLYYIYVLEVAFVRKTKGSRVYVVYERLRYYNPLTWPIYIITLTTNLWNSLIQTIIISIESASWDGGSQRFLPLKESK